ncbi:34 kDa spicule matrix protein-like [Lytechinus variegatus]|uniref:34 kDa spicule matrix protein-like n=1 Tax=Lytechinus variegatus TaxID=7654 RepID=UPI001BB14359|nr:34 kDa spicule matrix protein-like [Lytechinus variegatus]
MEAALRFACLVAGLIAVQAQCPPSWTKVENSCYRAFGGKRTYDMASQMCKEFVGCDGISPGHLACPTTFEERRVVRKLRFDLLQPLRGNRIGEGQRLRPQNVWLGFRLGQGRNSTWDSTEVYDNALLDEHWGPNRPMMPGQRPGGQQPRQTFDPTNFRWNGRCMTLPGQMQMNGGTTKWGHQACNMAAAFICEISPAGTVNPNINTGGRGGFNESTGMGPGMPGGGRGGWGQGGQGGQGGWGAGAGAGQGGWGNQNPNQGGGRWNPNQGAGGGRWNPNQGQGGGWNPNQGAGAGWNPNQGAGGGRWNPNQGQGGAGGWNPQRPGAGGWNPQNPNQGGGRWPQQPRMYQQAQAIAMP